MMKGRVLIMGKYIKSFKVSTVCKFAVIGLLLVFLGIYPLWGARNTMNVFLLMFQYMALAQMWNLLGGYAGLVSLGQQIFVGLGGYSLAIIVQKYGLPVYVGIAVAGVVASLFALAISFPIFKMKGVYFTIGTWIVAEGLILLFKNWGFVDYSIGINITAAWSWTIPQLYYLSLGVTIAAFLVVYSLLRSKLGLALMAMRDNDAAAEVRGVGLYGTKLRCFLISAFMTGVIGATIYLNLGTIMPGPGFGIDWTIIMVFIVIIGGIGTMEGPIIGAVIFVLLRQYLFAYPGISMAILGLLAIIIILAAPRGVMGIIHEKTGFEVFSARRRAKTMRRKLGIAESENT